MNHIMVQLLARPVALLDLDHALQLGARLHVLGYDAVQATVEAGVEHRRAAEPRRAPRAEFRREVAIPKVAGVREKSLHVAPKHAQRGLPHRTVRDLAEVLWVSASREVHTQLAIIEQRVLRPRDVLLSDLGHV